MAFKMKGFGGFKSSPITDKPKKSWTEKSEAAANLLKAVPNKEAYDKLSDTDKKGFDKAAGEAGLPMEPIKK